MQPTENETTVAMTAAAKHVYDERRGMESAKDQTLLPTWEQLDPMARSALLDSVTHVVWAALVALPDRLSPIRQLMHEVNPKVHQDMVDFHAQVTRWLSGSKG